MENRKSLFSDFRSNRRELLAKDIMAPEHVSIESKWVQDAKRGDPAAFDALVQAHGRHVLRYLQGLTNSREDAEDLVQETFCEALRSLRNFTDGAAFRPWIFTIAYRCWVHWRRKEVRSAQALQPMIESASAPGNSDGSNGNPELDDAIRGAVASLPDEQRAVFLLRFSEDLSHAEIAAITGAEVATVRWRLFQARQTMRRVLKAWAPGATPEKAENTR